jgi:Tfp pilus assembly protein PilF
MEGNFSVPWDLNTYYGFGRRTESGNSAIRAAEAGRPRRSARDRISHQAAQNPQDPSPPLQLANYLYDHGDYSQAVVWYQKATQLDPTNVSASTDLGTCYFNLGKFDQALQQLRHSLTIEPQHQPTLYNMVVVNMEGKHDYKAAEQAWQKLGARHGVPVAVLRLAGIYGPGQNPLDASLIFHEILLGNEILIIEVAKNLDQLKQRLDQARN